MNPCCLIFGFGYTAHVLAPQLMAMGFRVIGTSRSPKEAPQNDLNLKIIDFKTPKMEAYLSLATHLLISIPPDTHSKDTVLANYSELIKKHAPHIQWIGYLSSTGVYGDHQGNWVSEDSACSAQSQTSIARLKAEQAWYSFGKAHKLPLHIFRLSGIYGPGRNALERIVQGKQHRVFKEHQVFCRIHVEDIASTLLASMNAPNPLSIYNVSDDEPAPTHVVDEFAAQLLHKKPLPLIPYSKAQLSPMEQEFYSNNRRVSNVKIKKELHVVLKYPTYKEGLTQIWRNDFAPK